MSVCPWVIKNADIVAKDTLAFPYDDCGFLYGYGLFETIRILNKVPLFLEKHFSRLQQSAIIMDLVVEYDLETLDKLIRTLIKKNDIENGVLNLYVTGGDRPDSLYELGLEPPLLLGTLRVGGGHQDPISLGVRQESFQRTPLDNLKTMAWVKNILEKRLAPEYSDILLYDVNETILEATTANVFFIRDNILVTPRVSVILPGVTREYLIAHANRYGFSVEERDISVSELSSFDELFLTNAGKGVIKVSSVEGYDHLCSKDKTELISMAYTKSIVTLSQSSLKTA